MRLIAVLAVLATLSASALTQTATDQDHAAHHPPGASAPVAATKALAKAPATPVAARLSTALE